MANPSRPGGSSLRRTSQEPHRMGRITEDFNYSSQRSQTDGEAETHGMRPLNINLPSPTISLTSSAHREEYFDTSHHSPRTRGDRPLSSSMQFIDESDIREIQNAALALTRRDSVASHRPTTVQSRRGSEVGVAVIQRRASMKHAQVQTDEDSGLEQDDEAVCLDPRDKNFNLERWLQNFMQSIKEEGIKLINPDVVLKNLGVSGSGEALQLQPTLSDIFKAPLRLGEILFGRGKIRKQILRNINGIVRSGELLIVLGRPGSGCSTLLKSMTGEANGLEIDEGSSIRYNGIAQKQMVKEFKGEMVYNQEVDKHFPHLTVGQTLEFAAATRAPSVRFEGMTRAEYSTCVAQIIMGVCGLSHTYNTKVGNDFVRGVSGGERKRVSIAEMMVAGSSVCAWDNSTRGLDSATALKFVHTLRLHADFDATAHAVAIYQASQAIYDVFDKATVLYEGRQIYFGPANKAKDFFIRQGWDCPSRQTTGDFLTSVTNPGERRARFGMEDNVPRTPEDFERYWLNSPEYYLLMNDIDAHEHLYSSHTSDGILSEFRGVKNSNQAENVRSESSYTISMPMQIALTTKRAYQRIWNDKAATLVGAVSNIIIALIVGSMYYGQADDTNSIAGKNAALFLAVLANALASISEIGELYDVRPVVEKHASYRFYHPATEAIAGVVADVPIKFITAIAFNVILYFLAGLQRKAGQFFLYFLIVYICTFCMSAIFKTMGAITRTVSQAMALAGVLVLAIVIYTGFVIAPPQMHPWFGWIRWINPAFYAFEILLANEYHGRNISCAVFIPKKAARELDHYVCSNLGAVPGEETVNGDAYLAAAFDYSWSRVWRNFGILCAFLIFFMIIYFVATELNSSTSSTAEVLVFRRGHVPPYLLKASQGEKGLDSSRGPPLNQHTVQEAVHDVRAVQPQSDVFTWRDVVYDIEIKGEPRRLLDHVSGWVKPGTLTALMGVSGAGKTTLLDVLAHRTSIGVITGDMLVNGRPLDAGFQRSTGYVQQQDLHLETATVRESLRFSALLRQPRHVSTLDKYAFVEDVIQMLNMSDFADAIVGTPGQGLNVEQRKLLTIGVELAAKPQLLLFLDEPTSGLDSQSSWAICSFLRKLADAGQAVLCTIHQPSAVLFQEFDRLLFLAKGGKTVYFGEVGRNSRTLLDYFEGNGARKCSDQENPAEYMLEIVNGSPKGLAVDWHIIWNASQERAVVEREIDRIHMEKQKQHSRNVGLSSEEIALQSSEFAAPFSEQLYWVTRRIFQQYWRMPSYILAKWFLGTVSALFIGFSFYQSPGASSMASMTNVIFSVFMVTTIFTTMVEQVQPMFVTQRSLYEVRERPSKAYDWKAFMIANIAAEIPYQIITGIAVFVCVYYPIAGIQSSQRQVLVLLFMVQFFIYASTFAHLTIAALPDASTAGAVVSLLALMSLMFCGVLASPDTLPRFWIFMYSLSPFTYWISGIVATQLHERPIRCLERELSIFDPPPGLTCGEYMEEHLADSYGSLVDPNATSNCRYCALQIADQSIAHFKIFWEDRWRNFGIFWAYIIFNVAATIALYYLFRVTKVHMAWGKRKEKGRRQQNQAGGLSGK